MNTKDNMLTDISAELDKEFGEPGTPERAKFDEEAYAFYTSQILLDARKEAKVTQAELAKRIRMRLASLEFRQARMAQAWLPAKKTPPRAHLISEAAHALSSVASSSSSPSGQIA